MYISEIKNIECIYNSEKKQKDNYRYITNYYNNLIRRISPNITTMSNYNFEMLTRICYILKKCIDGYIQILAFIKQLFKNNFGRITTKQKLILTFYFNTI